LSVVARHAPAPVRAAAARRALGLAAIVVLLAGTIVLSVAVGARSIPVDEVWRLAWSADGSEESIIVHELRLPRTVLGLMVGAALGVSGALMQAVTRNPLADPGLLGVTAGAAAAVVTAAAVFGATEPLEYVWFALAGAAAGAVVVYGIGAAGRSGATPVRLALAGMAVSFTLLAYVQGMTLLDPAALDSFRFWQVGSLAGHPPSLNGQIAPFVALGLVLALLVGRSLNAIALGDEAGRAVGASPGRTRVASALAIALLCGAATAAAGPIVFVGLAVPHVARAIVGPDHRWVILYSVLLAPAALLAADVLGRVLERPGELEAGIVTAVAGAPLFIAIVRRGRIAHL
jgi:iron-siderophore transport system permease protein